MSSFLVSALSFVIALGILIAVHEFGHFWVARRLGVKVLRFSIGFGKPLWSRRGRTDQTEYVIAAIPLGGYVKMLDEQEGEVAADELHRAFNRQLLWKRTAIVAAGPIFNFIFAIAAYSAVFLGGVEGTRPIIGEVSPSTIAAQSGFEVGDEFVSIAGDKTPTWDSVTLALLDGTMEGRVVPVELKRNANLRLLNLDLSEAAQLLKGQFILETLGIAPWRPELPAVIDRVVEGGAADVAGLQDGDDVVAVQGEYIQNGAQLVEVVRSHPDREMTVAIWR